MAGSKEHPFEPGEYPITHSQYEMGCRVVAELCEFYNIPVTPKTVLNHGEVESVFGIEQRGKWDVMVLPWAPGLTFEQVGKKFRERVSYYLWELKRSEETEIPTESEDLSDFTQGIVVAESGLRLRAGPGVYSKILSVLPNKTVVEVIDHRPEQDWVKIKHKKMIGFVYHKWLKQEGPVG
jgi:hypothetical protein